MNRRILVVEEPSPTREHLRKILESDGHEIVAVDNGWAACESLREGSFQLVITDLRVAGMSSLELLAKVRGERMPVGLIVLTAYADAGDAFKAMKAGADEFVTKPYDEDHLRFLVRRILDRRRLIDELDHLRSQLKESHRVQTMVSKHPRMRKIFELIDQVGPIGSTVLIGGETGTGKELVAQAIHAADKSRTGPYIAVNCAVLNESVLESELFGHERGAFTGADRRKIGRFEMADRGTLLLDEIADTPLMFQAKLLRVLQSGTFERVGGTETVEVDVRILAATNKRLEDEVREGRFRADLYYRLNVIRIELPPLRERLEDIPLLATHFAELATRRNGTTIPEIDDEAMQALLQHSWPGNVRELQNAILSAAALSDSGVIRRDDLPDTVVPRAARTGSRQSLIDVTRPLHDLTEDLVGRIEREYFVRILRHFQGNVARCARHSGLSRRSVAQKMQKYGLDRHDFKKADPLKGAPRR